MADVEAIKKMTMQDRLKEAFKRTRRAGIGARMGPAWDAMRELKKNPKHCFVPNGDYQLLNQSYARNRSVNVKCTTPELDEVEAILKSCGIKTERRTPGRDGYQRIFCSGKDDSTISTTSTYISPSKLTREMLVGAYEID